MDRFEVIPVQGGDGWFMVVNQPMTFIAAMFRPEHRDMAQEMADRLNVRALAKESRS
jgi:hypothetical protein